ncbi:MAG: hypothetical protein HEQ32_05755 [Vampirovibrio sp.]
MTLLNSSFSPLLSNEAVAKRLEEHQDYFKVIQPYSLDLYENLGRWLPCIQHYDAFTLKPTQQQDIDDKLKHLIRMLQDHYAFTPVELSMVETVGTWGLSFLEKQGFADAVDHSLKVAFTAVALCRYLELPREIYSMAVLVSLLHDPKDQVDEDTQIAVLVSHPSLASALLTLFLSPEASQTIGVPCLLEHLEAIAQYYDVSSVDLAVSAVSALMENIDSGFVVEGGFVKYLNQVHHEKSCQKNSLIVEATPFAMEGALELAESIRMQYLSQLFCVEGDESASPDSGFLENTDLEKVAKEIHIRSGYPHVPPLPISDVLISHTHLQKEHQTCQQLGAILGAADNGQLNGYKIIEHSTADYITRIQEAFDAPSSSYLNQWISVCHRYHLTLPACLDAHQFSMHSHPSLMVNAFGESLWRSVIENYLYLKNNVSHIIALHYVVREGIAFIAGLQRYSESIGFGSLCLSSRFGDFLTADSWLDALEEIAYDEEFLCLLYHEINEWCEESLLQWPDELPLDLSAFLRIYKQETERIEVVLPLIPEGRLPIEALKETASSAQYFSIQRNNAEKQLDDISTVSSGDLMNSWKAYVL